MQVGVNSGAAAHALARFILDNVADDPSSEGVVITQQSEGVYIGAGLASATISLNGDTDEDSEPALPSRRGWRNSQAWVEFQRSL